DFIIPYNITNPLQLANGESNFEFLKPNWVYYSKNEDLALFITNDSSFNSNTISTSTYQTITDNNVGMDGLPIDWLTNPYCNINNIDFIFNDGNSIKAMVQANFNTAAAPPLINYLFQNHTDVLSQNYFMKTFVFIQARNLDTTKHVYLKPVNFDGYYTYNQSNYSQGNGTTYDQFGNFPYYLAANVLNLNNHTPIVKLKPNNLPPNIYHFDLNYLKNKCRFGEIEYCGNYEIRGFAIPVDGKCDINTNGKLEYSTEYYYLGDAYAYVQIYPDAAIDIEGDVMSSDNTLNTYNDNYLPFLGNIYKLPINNSVKVVLPGNTFINTTTGKIYYIKEGGEKIHIPDFAFGLDKNITIIRNGNVSSIPIEFSKIALHAPKLRKFHSFAEAKEYIQKSYLLMKELNITKTINYDNITNKTQYKININNIDAGKKNFTLYQVFSKREADSVKKIKFIDDGGMQRFVVDADPVIGWHIEDPDENETIIYETNGTGEGATIIITQEPVIFNDGDLIVNYREIQCNASNGEVALFQLDDLEDSPVFSMSNGNHFYKVCLSYLNSSKAVLSDTIGNLRLDIFNHTEGGNVSFLSTLDNEIQVFATNFTESMFWDLKIQENNPAGDYSCIGSINNNYSSTFGDCAYNPQKRVWVHLGPDNIAPTTTLTFPYLSHTVKIILDAQDNIGGSGIKELSYRIDGSPWVMTAASQISFALTCPSDWGCTRTIEFFAEDLDGNVEAIKSQSINLID
ncbi:MAG: hypothetical protein KC550_05835, partial [Nanoarchaeota archaeon]|nr:hypothetical protein [Nanoarchaeota archaeon]